MGGGVPDFSIVTPSYNSLAYLPAACASVADQEGATFEHTVVDAASGDGTPAWLKANPHVTSIVEPDEGMYDAINKGWRRARGRFVGYLNCDEQYLPGTLAAVKRFFDDNPAADWLFGDTLVIRPDGDFLHYRKLYPARLPYIQASFLYLSPCSVFLRRELVDAGYFFDTRFRYCGDQELVCRILKGGYASAHLRRYLSAAMVTGRNMVASPGSLAEMARHQAGGPAWVRCLRRPINLARLAEKFAHGAYFQSRPLGYSVYTVNDTRARTRVSIERPTFRFTGYDLKVAEL